MALEPDPHEDAREDARASLSDLERIERRTREAVRYSYASTYQIMWGILVAAGYLLEYFSPRSSDYTWIGALVIGIAGGVVVRRVRARQTGRPTDYRVLYGQIAVIVFGFLWTTVLTDATSRQVNALWPTFYMFAMVLFGIWVGRFFIVLGITVTVLVAIGYLWTGAWFLPWMAVVAGGALLASGLYLRQIGLRQS